MTGMVFVSGFVSQPTPFPGPPVFFEFEDVLLLFQSPFVVVVIGLFRLLTYSWLNFDGFIESRKLYISIGFSSLTEEVFKVFSYNIPNCFGVCCNIFLFHFYCLFGSSLFYYFTFGQLDKVSVNIAYFLKEPAFRFINSLYCFLCFYCINFCSVFFLKL